MVLELQFVGFGLMGFNLNPQAQPSLKLMKANHTSRPTDRPPTGFVVWLSVDLDLHHAVEKTTHNRP